MIQIKLLALMVAAGAMASGCEIVSQVATHSSHTGHGPNYAKGPQVKGKGPMKTESRKIGDFNGINVGANFEVNLQVGPKPSLKVEAQENLLKHIVVKVQDGVLVAGYNVDSISTDKSVKLTLTTPRLTSIDSSGAAIVSVKGVKTDSFEVDASGATKLTVLGTASNLHVDGSGAAELVFDGFRSRKVEADLSGACTMQVIGSAGDLALDLSGASNFKGERLEVTTATVDSGGGSSAFLNVRGTLKVTADGGSNVRYKGGAKTTVETSGGASVERA